MPFRLEDLASGARVEGIEPQGSVLIKFVRPIGQQAVEVAFEGSGGSLQTRLLYREDEVGLRLAEASRPWSFDGDGSLLRLASEAYRFQLAWLFDPFVAINASAIEPLPHQISAVYESMLPRLPMRFLLADDPGAGKTIMAGLLIKEMLVRGDLSRCLIISPGSLTEQWQDELGEKFGLDFELLTRDMITASRTANPFRNHHHLIARMDQLSRNPDLQERLKDADEWDLVIVDEAHRMSASYQGGEVKRTKRYGLGEVVGAHCRNFLLMTATPHNGYQESFELFMALLDGDRFVGKAADGVHQQDPSDLMRRMVKEELVRFDGRKLFPERKSYTAEYDLSPAEANLYKEVTEYVREEMNRADKMLQGEGSRRTNVGFALMTLQRRLASSPRSIYISLQRRRERLESRASEARVMLKGELALEELFEANPLLESEGLDDLDELYDDAPQEELDELEEGLVDNATAARTIEELQAEIEILKGLESLARDVVFSGQDAKWTQLQSLLESEHMVGPNRERRKLVIFSEFKDTLTYLEEKIRSHVGRAEAVVQIHGGVAREDRRKIIHAFMNDPEVVILIANDAAGEGVNLQRAHLMVNYDLPWNPNRLEQRFGRIHRIGQKEVCHLWNLIAKDTREGDVYLKLFQKLEAEAEALGGKVFDVLGQLFEQSPLRQLLMEAIRYGESPEVIARRDERIQHTFDFEHIQSVLARNALTPNRMDPSRVQSIKEEMDRAEARRLQPHFVEAFFKEAFGRLGGSLHKRERGRFEITQVPQSIRDRDRVVGSGAPVLKRYERICFQKEFVGEQPRAELLTLGHPLLESILDLIQERFGEVLTRGAILVDEDDLGEEPHLLFFLEHAMEDGRLVARDERRVISKRLQFLEVGPTSGFRKVGSAPYLDYRPLGAGEAELLEPVVEADWMKRDWEQEALQWAAAELVPGHVDEVKRERLAAIDKIHAEVRARLTREITHWDHRAQQLRQQEQAGKQTRLPAKQASDRASKLVDRLQAREAELERERAIHPLPPRLQGGALIVPAGLLRKLRGEAPAVGDPAADAEARRRVELLAMDAVMAAERRLGREPRDVSDTRGIGHDIESVDPRPGGETVVLEVKGRAAGASQVSLTVNEIRCALNVPERFRLAIVEVEGDRATEPVYVTGFDFGQPGFGQTSSSYSLQQLLSKGGPPR